MAGKLTELAAGVLMTHYTRSKVDLAGCWRTCHEKSRRRSREDGRTDSTSEHRPARGRTLGPGRPLLPAAGRELCARAARVLSRFAGELATEGPPPQIRVIMVDFHRPARRSPEAGRYERHR